jgi:outer membrane receptor protein involved in Fe transport
VADSPDLFGTGTPTQVNRVVRGFVHETARLTDQLSLVGGVSLEELYYMGTRHADYQAALLYEAARGHVLRASYSMAHTNPGFTDSYPNYVAASMDGVGPTAQVLPNPYLKSYELQNYETGYRGFWLDQRLETGVSLYYMKIRDHVNIEDMQKEGRISAAAPPEFFQYDNSNYLIGRGVELEAKADLGAGRSAYANWSHEIVTDRDGHSVYIRTTPSHIVNLGLLAPLPGEVTAAVNAGYKDGYLADSITGSNQVDIRPFWRLDARLSWRPLPGAELFVGGHNLLSPRTVEFVDGLTVPRRWYGGVRVRFR